MANATDPKTKDAILSILLEAKQCGVGKVTRTALVKYVYLMDFWTAEETRGTTFTGIEWKFHHFGPYSDSLAADLDMLSTQPAVCRDNVTGKNNDYSLYSLGGWAKAVTFEALGLALDVRLKLVDAIKRYATDLNALLHFVYFQTTPMHGSIPGAILSFADSQKLNYKTDLKTIRIPIIDAKKAARIKLLLEKIGKDWEEEHKPNSILNPPIRDSLFMESIDDEGLNGIAGDWKAALSFREEKN